MYQILTILKKYSLAIIVIVGLLFIQANCDLALPEYTSNIINVGIQQQGVDTAYYKVVRANVLNKLAILTNDDILAFYQYISSDSPDYEEYLSKYPILKDESIYILKDDVDPKKVEEQMILPEVIYMGLSSQMDLSKMTTEELSYLLTTNASGKMAEYQDKMQDIDPDLMKQYAINAVIAEYQAMNIDLENMQMKYLTNTGIKMVLLSLLIMAIIILSTFVSGVVASSFARDLRSCIVHKIMNYSNKEFNEFSTSSLITRSTNDVQQIQMMFTMLMRMILYAPIIGIGALVKVVHINMVWVIGIGVGAILILVITLMVIAMPKFQIVQKLIDRINLVVREILNGLPVIRAFANEEHERRRFDKANKDLMCVNLFTQRLMALMGPMMNLIMNGIIVLIYWVGARNVDMGTMQVGTLTALITYTMQVIMSFLMLSMMSIMAPRAIVAIKRVAEVLNKDIAIKEKKNCLSMDPKKRGLVEFRDVTFQYPDGEDEVLKDISFVAKPGQTIAIIGATGSGKSTIINLIPRFFDVTKGEILVGGVNIKDLSFKELRSAIGVVPQKGLLFSGTIASNIKFANPDISDEKMREAAKVACAEEFILNKEDEYLAPISQGGDNVSGGQRQRLAIARAIAKEPDILLFDDSFSALDYKTDREVRRHLARYCKNATKIIVAQRVATVMNADAIIVIDDGKIVGMGSHKELYRKCPLYKEIALSQLKEEELI